MTPEQEDIERRMWFIARGLPTEQKNQLAALFEEAWRKGRESARQVPLEPKEA